jgi:hypothetical protein
MLRKITVACVMMILFTANAMALCLYKLNGLVASCSTCSCKELTDAGIGWSQCIDLAKQANDPKKGYDKLIRYSGTEVRVHSVDGSESPLSSDASQKQFDEIMDQRNSKERLRRFKLTAGSVSEERARELSKMLGIPVENGKRGETRK